MISFRARRRQVVRQERADRIAHEIREQIELLARCEAGDPEALRQAEENARIAGLAFPEPAEADYPDPGQDPPGGCSGAEIEVQPYLDMWAVPRPKPRAWWLYSADPTNGCPCLPCVEARANPMAERPPRRVSLSEADLEQFRIHEARLARDLALWYALDWKPRASAEAAQLRPDDRPTEFGWARFRLGLEAAGVVLSPLSPDHDPLLLADRWLEVCPAHGPPAVTRRIASRPEALLTCP